jgi:hypothetical protein
MTATDRAWAALTPEEWIEFEAHLRKLGRGYIDLADAIVRRDDTAFQQFAAESQGAGDMMRLFMRILRASASSERVEEIREAIHAHVDFNDEGAS